MLKIPRRTLSGGPGTVNLRLFLSVPDTFWELPV